MKKSSLIMAMYVVPLSVLGADNGVEIVEGARFFQIHYPEYSGQNSLAFGSPVELERTLKSAREDLDLKSALKTDKSCISFHDRVGHLIKFICPYSKSLNGYDFLDPKALQVARVEVISAPVYGRSIEVFDGEGNVLTLIPHFKDEASFDNIKRQLERHALPLDISNLKEEDITDKGISIPLQAANTIIYGLGKLFDWYGN